MQTYYGPVFCIIRSRFELLVYMVLFMDGVTRLHRLLPTYQLSFKSKEVFVDGH